MGASSAFRDQGDHRSRTKRAAQLAGRQYGAIARWRLLRQGFSASQIRSWLRSGRLHPRYPGVYALGRAELGVEGEIAAGILCAGPGAALGGVSVLWWRELLEHRPRLIHLDAPGESRSRSGLLIRHPRMITRELHRGLPVVRLPQALLSSAGLLGHNSLRLVLARAEFKGELSLPSLREAFGSGRGGSRALQAALDSHLPQLARCTNPLEVDFVLLCERFGLPLPEPNLRIGRYRPDMLWREPQLVVELDGRRAHSTEAQAASDEQRQAVLEALGYTVLRFSWAEVHLEPDRVASEVRSAMIPA